MCEPEEVALESLEEATAYWERSVRYIEEGFDYSDDHEEYTHDLFSRDVLHGILNGLQARNWMCQICSRQG